MSKHETSMTRWYWKQVGGMLVEDYVVVEEGADCGRRVLDAVIFPAGENRVAGQAEAPVEGKDVIVLSTKVGRMGMNLVGQALVSAQLLTRLGARTVESVALCGKDDSVLRPLLEQYPGMKVVVCSQGRPPRRRSS